MDDPFKDVPTELVLQIMKSIPSIHSLYHFTKASKVALRVFKTFPAEILEEVIRPLPGDLQRVIRDMAMVLLRLSAIQHPRSYTLRQMFVSALEGLSIKATKKIQFFVAFIPLASVEPLVNYVCHTYRVAALYLECHIRR